MLFSALVLDLLGTLNALFLSLVGLFGVRLMFPCCREAYTQVHSERRYSHAFGVPVAVLGALTYLTLDFLILLQLYPKLLQVPELISSHALMISWLLAMFGTIFSLRLMYGMFHVIRMVCPFCLTSALLMTITAILLTFKVCGAGIGSTSIIVFFFLWLIVADQKNDTVEWCPLLSFLRH